MSELPKSHSDIGISSPSCAFGNCSIAMGHRASSETERMAKNGTAMFATPDDYQAAVGVANVNLVVTGGGDFNARLTWLNLNCLHALRGFENLPRIAFVSLPPAQLFVSFPTSVRSSLTYGGGDLRCGDLVFHARGERMPQRSSGESQWGRTSFTAQRLASSMKAITAPTILVRPP